MSMTLAEYIDLNSKPLRYTLRITTGSKLNEGNLCLDKVFAQKIQPLLKAPCLMSA